MGDLVTALRHHDPGDRIRLGFVRSGAPHWTAVLLAETS
jgi:S1-C subfamily serine protease